MAVRYEEEHLEVGMRVVRRTARVTEPIRSALRRTPASVESSITMRAPRGGRHVLAHAFVAMQGKPLELPTRTAPQIQHTTARRYESREPISLRVDHGPSPARQIVPLVEMLGEYPRAELRITPGQPRAQTHRNAHHELGQVHHR